MYSPTTRVIKTQTSNLTDLTSFWTNHHALDMLKAKSPGRNIKPTSLREQPNSAKDTSDRGTRTPCSFNNNQNLLFVSINRTKFCQNYRFMSIFGLLNPKFIVALGDDNLYIYNIFKCHQYLIGLLMAGHSEEKATCLSAK